MRKFYVMLTVGLLCNFMLPCSYAQTRDNSTVIYIWDKADMTILIGAHVALTSGKETINGVSEKYNAPMATLARFGCENIFSDSVSLSVTYIGYKPFKKSYSAEEFRGAHHVLMEQDTMTFSQIIVVGERVAMVIKGDTTIYNASSFKTMEGDRFAALLRQLPGVELRDNKIYANGEQIQKVYIDGRNMFGTNSSFALTDLKADDVKQVKIYEQDTPESIRLADNTAPKERVMDVETHSKANVIQGGSVKVSGGASLEKDFSGKHEVRHSQELSLYRNSELGNIRLTASNRKNDGAKDGTSFGSKVTPSENTDVYLFYDYRRGDSTNLTSYVNFNRNRTTTSVSEYMEYFATPQYTTRTSRSVTDAMANDWSIGAGVGAAVMRRKNTFALNMDMNLNNARNTSVNSTIEHLDDKVTQTFRTDRSRRHELKLDPSLYFRRALSPKSILMVNASASYSSSDSDGWSVDTLTKDSNFRVLLNNAVDGESINAGATIGLRTKTSEHSSLNFSYIFSRNHNKQKQISLDYLDMIEGALDRVNSYDYTINSVSNAIYGDWSYKKSDFNCSVSLRATLYGVKLDEQLPTEGHYPHTFFLLNPNVNLSWGKPQNRIAFNVGSYSHLMSVEMLRNSLNINNPMYIVAGNPNLRPSNNTTFNLSYSTTKAAKARTWEFNFFGGYIFNDIVSKRTLYMQSEYLPQYDYTVAQGAQLTTNLNVDGNWKMGASAGYSKRMAWLKSTFYGSLSYKYSKEQYYVGESLEGSYNQEAGLLLSLNTGFSSKVRVNLSSTTSFGNYKTYDAVSRYIRESVNCGVDVRPMKRYFILVNAAYQLYHNGSMEDATQNNVIANASLGRKFGKGDKFSLAAGIVDIFNRTSYIATMLNSDYLRTQTTSYLGRYAYLTFSYEF